MKSKTAGAAYKTARGNLLAMLVLTAVNTLLALTGSGRYYLFTDFAAYIWAVFARGFYDFTGEAKWLVLGAAGFAFAEPVVTLFRRSDPEVIRIGTETFRIQILTVWAWGFITLSNMYTQAIGYGIRSTILAAARQGLFLIPTLLVLPNVWGLRGLEVCQPLADVLTLALAVWMMTKVIRTQKAQMAQETA